MSIGTPAVRPGLLVAVHDATLRQVIRRHLHVHAITGQDANREPPHFARREAENRKAIFKFNAELGVWERFGDSPFLLDGLLFGQVVRC